MIERIKNLLRQGCSNKEIQREMRLTKSGVTYYTKQLMREFGLYGIADERRLIVRLLTEEK